MNYFDDENIIIELFQNVPKNSIWLLNDDEATRRILESIHCKDNWKHWTDSSMNNSPPPDFYSDSYGLMMDVMRIDDHAHLDSNGKCINPVNQRESKIQKEIKESRLLEGISKNIRVFVNAVTNLPTIEDHNYSFYYSNFQRVLKKHFDSVPLYKSNHAGYKTIFFVFDESSGYAKVLDKSLIGKGIKKGQAIVTDEVYCHFIDKRLIDIFVNSEIDYLIWFSPFKHFESTMPEFPIAAIYDVNAINKNFLKLYPQELMLSMEE